MRKEKKYCENCRKETTFVEEGWGTTYGYGLKCSECQSPERRKRT
jgi:ribosomal protein L33